MLFLAYGFAVQPDKNKNEFLSGWTKALSEEDAMEKIMIRYTGVPRDQIKVFSYGETWESFIREGDNYGWD